MEIACSLKETHEYGRLLPEQKKKKKGRYHGSFFAVDGFGINCWVVGVYIIIDDYEHYSNSGHTDEQIAQGCVDYLNKPPVRKKYQRRVSKPLYGKLEIYRADYKESEDGDYFEALLITDERKNKHFWSEGQRIIAPRKRKKRKK